MLIGIALQASATSTAQFVIGRVILGFGNNIQQCGSLILISELAYPDHRPKIEQVLQIEGVQWVQGRRRAGATIFEGNWGPADEMLGEDAEMIDV